MQMAKPFLIASQPATILGGFLGSILFVFLLTGLGNLEKMAFGSGFQTKLPESLFCLIIAVMASGSVHRVSASTCVLFSAAMLYSMNSISNQVHGSEKITEGDKKEKSKKRKWRLLYKSRFCCDFIMIWYIYVTARENKIKKYGQILGKQEKVYLINNLDSIS